MRILRGILPCVLALILVFGTAVPVAGNDGSIVRRDALTAGYMLAEAIDIILSYYAGGPVTAEELLRAAMQGMTSILDRYSFYMNEDEFTSFAESITGTPLRGIGVSMQLGSDGRVTIINVFPDAPAEAAGVQPGDVILYVDGEPVTGTTLDFVGDLITNPETARTVIDVERGGNRYTFDIEKAAFRTPTVMTNRLEDFQESEDFSGIDNFAVIHVRSVGRYTSEDIRRAIYSLLADGVEGIILDLRGNAGGYLEPTIDIANQLVPQGIVLQTVNQSGEISTYSSTLTEPPFEYVVVLVNRFTASAAEVIASALQDSDAATIVGESTFGKGSVQSMYSMLTGGVLKLTTEEYFRRNGDAISGVGVIPCIRVQSGQRAGEQDTVLRRGIEVLLEKAGL